MILEEEDLSTRARVITEHLEAILLSPQYAGDYSIFKHSNLDDELNLLEIRRRILKTLAFLAHKIVLSSTNVVLKV